MIDIDFILRQLLQQLKMNDSHIQKLSQYLTLPTLSSQLITSIEKQQHNLLWKSLLMTTRSTKIQSHPQAIAHLKSANTTLQSAFKSITKHQPPQFYNSAIISIKSHLLSRLALSNKFNEAEQVMRGLKSRLKTSTDLKKSIMVIFGVESLLILREFDIFSNLQFTYDDRTKRAFLLMVAQMKYYLGKQTEAKTALQKYKQLRDLSFKRNSMQNLTVAYLLKQIHPQQYTDYYNSIKEGFDKDAIEILPHLIQFRSKLIGEFYQLQNKFDTDLVIKQIKSSGLLFLRLYIRQLLKSQIKQKECYQTMLCLLKNQYNSQTIRQLTNTQMYQQSIVFGENCIKRMINATRKVIWRFFLLKLTPQSKQNSSIIVNSKSKYYPYPLWQNLKLARKNKFKFNKQPFTTIYANVHSKRNIPNDQARIKSIIEALKKGAMVKKINYGNKDIQDKFLMLTEKELHWSKNPEDIKEDYSLCKIKHILGIVYGKVSTNLTKRSFQDLEPWKCFSIITQERTYDFYCKAESQVFFWLQGLSYFLQLKNNNANTYPFYSKGRALWKMAFQKIQKRYPSNTKYKNKLVGSIIAMKQSLNH